MANGRNLTCRKTGVRLSASLSGPLSVIHSAQQSKLVSSLQRFEFEVQGDQQSRHTWLVLTARHRREAGR
jgi:hypothetical protein